MWVDLPRGLGLPWGWGVRVPYSAYPTRFLQAK